MHLEITSKRELNILIDALSRNKQYCLSNSAKDGFKETQALLRRAEKIYRDNSDS